MKRISYTCASFLIFGRLLTSCQTGEKKPEAVAERTTGEKGEAEKKTEKEKKKFDFNKELQKERDKRHKE